MKKQPISLFDGEVGRRRLVELLSEQKSVLGDRSLAEELAELVVPLTLADGEVLISEGARYGSLFHPRRQDASLHQGEKARREDERQHRG